MIHIESFSDIKITKVKPWAICFDHKDDHYLIHGSAELGEPDIQTLYKRELNEHGNYKLTLIKRINGDDNVAYDYIPRQSGRTIVYSRIPLNVFVYKLTKRGFATGIAEDTVEKAKVTIQEAEKQISELEERIRKIRRTIAPLR